jgi:hypothetical protein
VAEVGRWPISCQPASSLFCCDCPIAGEAPRGMRPAESP